jgi:hypothetical protein
MRVLCFGQVYRAFFDAAEVLGHLRPTLRLYHANRVGSMASKPAFFLIRAQSDRSQD